MRALFIFCFCFSAWGSSHVATISKLQGKVELYAPVDLYPQVQGSHILYQSKTYRVVNAEVGTKVSNHMIVNTDKKSKAKIVFSNGDQIYVTPSSQYEVNWEEIKGKVKEGPTGINLMYGAIRMMVDKEGPRSGTKVKTRSATFAVRGTDFHVAQSGSSGTSQVSVLRGKVEATTLAQKNKKTEVVVVETGKSALTQQGQAQAELVKTTKQDLKQIALESKVEMKEEVIPEKLKAEINKLEEKATDNIMKDIKKADPVLYEQIKTAKITDVDSLNMKTVEKIYQAAPEAKGKPSWRELDEIESDPYGKYFKSE
jgi:hypothetical protein